MCVIPNGMKKCESRTEGQLREHYLVERELAERLRIASRTERRGLYTVLYDELYRRVPHHPRHIRRIDPKARSRDIARQLQILSKFFTVQSTFLELGPGDCELSYEIAKRVARVYAVDVATEITNSGRYPGNFQHLISDGTSVPVSKSSVDVAYSNQVMEHLHPDDAREQLENILTALTVGGIYVCLTPNRLNGPHDISKYFESVPKGFHLKEYTTTELIDLFKAVGFSRVLVLFSAKEMIFRVPPFLIRVLEGSIGRLPQSLARKIAGSRPLRLLLGIRVIGVK